MFQNSLKKSFFLVFAMTLVASGPAQAAETVVQFYGSPRQAHVTLPSTLYAGANANNTFTVQFTDNQGVPASEITKQSISASVEMTSMDMGVTDVTQIEDVLNAKNELQGKIVIHPEFSMRGPWKMNLTLTAPTADGQQDSETQSFRFSVTK